MNEQPAYMRCKSCCAVSTIGHLAECDACGSRYLAPYTPLPPMRIRTTRGAIIECTPADIVVAREVGQVTVLELSSGEEIEIAHGARFVEAQIAKILGGVA